MSELENRYSSLFGAKTSKGQLRGGFLTLGLGALFGVVALTLFFIGLANASDKTAYYNWMKGALTLAPLALAGILLGISLALPTTTGLRVAGAFGGFLCAISALLFFLHYPQNFNVAGRGSPLTDYMPMDVLIASTGIVLIGASIISSIVGYYLSKTTVVQGEAGEEEDIYGAGYEIPDWVVERDIEYAMKKYGVQWGEGGKDNESNTIVVNVADTFAGATIGGLGKARQVQLDADQVDAGVSQLTKTRPQKGGALPSQWADDATQALVAFRKQKEANPKQFAVKRGFWRRVADFFTGRSTVPAAPARPAPKASAPAGANGAAGPARRGKTIVIEDEK